MKEFTTTRITERLADFVLKLKYKDLPPNVITEAKNGILDFFGVALIGSREESTRIIRDACATCEKSGPATLLGTSLSSSLTAAAMVNAYAAHVLDYDDVQPVVGAHMSGGSLAATLALAESLHLSGKALICAYVAGFEIGCRLGSVGHFGHHLREHGIHPTGVLCHFAAVAAAGKLLGLDSLQTRRSFGIVAGHATGLMRSFGTMCKGQNAGNAAQNALFAALLAKKGFTGPENIFDGADNIFSIYGAHTDAEELTRNLSKQFEITRNTFKVYACAGWRNPIMEAMMFLAATHNLQPSDIKTVGIKVCNQVIGLPNYPQPRTGLEAKFSAQYAAAVALADQAGYVAQFADERVADPVLAELARKVALEADAGFELNQVRATIRTNDGRELTHFIAVPKGDHRNPLTWDELVVKFRTNALAALPAEATDKLAAAIQNLEKVADMSEVTQLCRPGRKARTKRAVVAPAKHHVT